MLDLVDVMMSEVNCDSRSCDVNWFVDRRVAAKVWIVGILDNMTMAMMDAKDRNNFVYLVVFPLFAREIISLPFLSPRQTVGYFSFIALEGLW